MPTNQEIEESVTVKPIPIGQSPLRKDVYGVPGKFIDELTMNIEHGELFEMMGTTPDKTFLLTGPPGVGKSMSLSATNNSINREIFLKAMANNKNINKIKAEEFGAMLFRYDIGQYGTAYINMGSRVIQQFFDKVGMFAQYGVPCIIEIDECDALFQSRQSRVQSHSEDRKVLETLMKNLQVAHDTKNMYVVAMTNLPDICDNAVLRSGRIDKKFKFELPKFEERKVAYDREIESLNERALYRVIRGAKPEILAEMSEGFNYADIRTAVDQAVRTRARDLIDEPEKVLHARPPYVSQNMLEERVKQINKGKSRQKAKIGF